MVKQSRKGIVPAKDSMVEVELVLMRFGSIMILKISPNLTQIWHVGV